jgi:hypothetical protein
MATTTNYGWTTPDDTALVKDGAAAIRTLGSSVDTTTKALNPSTTLGDIEYRSSTANTNTRLGIGTTGQVLAVSGGVPAWVTSSSGGMTLLSTTSLSGSASVTISSIDQTYNEIQIWCDGMKSTDNNVGMRVNGSSSNIYAKLLLGENNASTGSLTSKLSQVVQLQNSAQPGIFRMTCKGYTETDSVKTIVNNAAGRGTTGAGAVYNQANYIDIGAINSVNFFTEDTPANFTAGTIRIFGVK